MKRRTSSGERELLPGDEEHFSEEDAPLEDPLFSDPDYVATASTRLLVPRRKPSTEDYDQFVGGLLSHLDQRAEAWDDLSMAGKSDFVEQDFAELVKEVGAALGLSDVADSFILDVGRARQLYSSLREARRAKERAAEVVPPGSADDIRERGGVGRREQHFIRGRR